MIEHHLLWPVVLWHHPVILLDMGWSAALGWTWWSPPVRERVA